MYTSTVLGLPSFIDLDGVDPAIDVTIAGAMQTNSEQAGMSRSQLVHLKASAKHLEVMRLTAKAIKTLFPHPDSDASGNYNSGTTSVSIKAFEEVEREFREWAKEIPDVIPQDDDSMEFVK